MKVEMCCVKAIKNVLQITINFEKHARNIGTTHRFVRDCFLISTIKIKHITTNDQLAIIFFKKNMSLFNVRNIIYTY